MNQNLVGSIYGSSAIKMLIYFRFANKHGRHRQLLNRNYSAILTTLQITLYVGGG
jgi:hypothetical protein